MSRERIVRLMSEILRVLSIAIIVSSAATNAATDSLTGTWQAEVHGEAKTFTILFHFTVDGNTIKGTVESPAFDLESPISDGTLRGNEVRFTAAGHWHGSLEGKNLELTRELDGGKKQEMIARRAAQ